jgi:tetratricopeptide (TPR) repeat protein
MRTILCVGWLLVPVVVAAWHYGPGQERVRLDDTARALALADRHAARQEWAEAARSYDEALALLPPERVAEARRIRLERDKALMLAQQLPDAHEDLKILVEEMKEDSGAEPGVLAEARSTLANAQYYMTWLMRLEGQPKDLWEPEIEAARQSYRLLAEEAETSTDTATGRKHREDLEAAVRLARMDVSELQGLPLPSQ